MSSIPIVRRPHLFLSYGHRDATELALRLRCEFEAAGYSVWQDERRIRAGHSWTDEIRQGLRESDLVVALLSPHSVRHKGWGPNTDDQDSVCLNEIEYAVDACRIPVLPVMAVTCEPPFRIFRLQYYDFRTWRESAAVYEDLKKGLLTALAECLASGRAPLLKWERLPEPWDFMAFLAERRHRFMGRTWLFKALQDRLSNTTSTTVLLTGSPGVGKSAFFASLVHANPAGQILAYHCCQTITPATLSPVVFVRSLVAMIAARDAAYANILEHPDLLGALDEGKVAADPASAFEQLILNPLHKLPVPDSAPRLIMVDALDEALAYPGSLNLLDLLSMRLGAFPAWLKIVATTRDEWRVKRRFRSADLLVLDAATKDNTDDLGAYVTARLEAQPVSSNVDRKRDEVHSKVMARSSGNFLVAAQTLDALESGLLDPRDLDTLAPGLEALYKEFFDRLFKRPGVDFAPTRKLLQVIVAAQEPPSRDELAAVTGLDAEAQLPVILARLGSLIPPRNGRYSPFHQTLAEWLTDWDVVADQPLAEDYHISQVKGHRLWVDALLTRYAKGPVAWDGVLMRHLPTHLAGTKRWDEFGGVLLDPRFLEAKTCGPGTTVFGLLADFEIALRVMPKAHDNYRLLSWLHDIVGLESDFIARHPTVLFQCCWNRGWWSVTMESGRRSQSPQTAIAADALRDTFRAFLESWCSEKEKNPDTPHSWLRLTRQSLAEAAGPLKRIIRGQGHGIGALASVANTSYVVAGSSDGSVNVWDVLTGTLVGCLGRHDRAVNAIAMFSAGSRAVTVSDDQTVKVWDLATSTLSGTLKGHQREVDAVAVTDDGRQAFTASRDGTVRVWDLERLEQVDETKYGAWTWLKTLVVLEGTNHVVFPESQSVPTSLYPKTRSKLWDWAPQDERAPRGEFDGAVIAMIPLAHPMEFLIATNSGVSASRTERESAVLLFDNQSAEARKLFSWSGFTIGARSLALCGDAHGVVGLESGVLQIFSLPDGRITSSRLAHGSTISALCTASGGDLIVSGSSDGEIKVWHADRLGESDVPQSNSMVDRGNAAILDIAILHDGNHLVAVSRDGTGSVWQIEPPSRRHTFCYYGVDDLCKVARASIVEDGRVVDYLAHDHIYWHPIEEPGRYPIDLPEISSGIDQVPAVGNIPEGFEVQLSDGELVVLDQVSRGEMARYRGDSPLTKVVSIGLSIVCGDSQGELHFLQLSGLTADQ